MKALKLGLVILSAALITLPVSGCSNTTSSGETTAIETTAENAVQKELEKFLETTQETTTEKETREVLFEKDYEIGNNGDYIFLSLTSENEMLDISALASAENEDKATLMLLAYLYLMQNTIDTNYSICIMCNDLMVTYTYTPTITAFSGTNKDGSVTVNLPDWINEDIDIESEENLSYYIEVINAIGSFVSEYAGEEYEPITTEAQTTTQETTTKQETDTQEETTKNTQESKKPTLGEENALKKAERYLTHSAFSHDRLVEQLEYEGYSHEEAVYGADNCNADWNEQALKKALSYLKHSSFSYSGLYEQLEYEQFESQQIQYAVDNCGADWYEQSLNKALSYLSHSAFSYKGLYEQLEYEGFTAEQAQYGVDNCGADWNEQAKAKAERYLSHSSFSRQGLIDQLKYEGFTDEQAEYGVTAVGY